MLKETRKEFGILKKEEKFYNKLIKLSRDRMGDCELIKEEIDSFGNKLYVPAEIFSERLIVSYIIQTMQEIKCYKSISDNNYLFEKYFSLVIQGTTTKLLARQYLLESGRCFSEIKEDGTIIGPNIEVRNALFDLFKIEHNEYIIRLRG